MPQLRRAAVLAAVLVAAHVCGVPVSEAVSVLARALYTTLAALLLPSSGEDASSSLPEMHQALLTVTRDPLRVADLLDEFMADEGGAQRERFLRFLAVKANTHYVKVDNQLSWVLWLYSVVWLPLLILLCLTSAAARGKAAHQRAPAAQPAMAARISSGASPQPGFGRPASPSGLPRASRDAPRGSAPGQQHGSAAGEGPGPGLGPRRSFSNTLPSGDGSMRSASGASGRALRRSGSSAGARQLPPRASSECQRGPLDVLPPSVSLPPSLGGAAAAGGPAHLKRSASLAGAGGSSASASDLWAADHAGGERGSMHSLKLRMPRSTGSGAML